MEGLQQLESRKGGEEGVSLGMHVSLGLGQEGRFFLSKGGWNVSEFREGPSQGTVLEER